MPLRPPRPRPLPPPFPRRPEPGRGLQRLTELLWRSRVPPPAARLPTWDYLMACFSQAAYVPTDYDLRFHENVKFVPSELLQRGVARGASADVEVVIRTLFDEPEMRVDRIVTANSVSIVLNTPQVAIIAFRGTVPFHVTLLPTHDLLIDIRTWQVPLEPYRGTGERYHAGFLGEALHILPRLRDAYESMGAGRPIYFTGHSLGGALAAITNRLWEMDWADDPRRAIVFGCPRVGNAVAAARMPPVIAVENRGDPVPCMPRVRYATFRRREQVVGPDKTATINLVSNHSIERYRRAVASRHHLLADDAAFYRRFETIVAQPLRP